MSNYKSLEPCVCCGLRNPNTVCFHHLLTRGAHPEHADKPWNMIPVCLAHHNEFHNKGISHMASKYKVVKEWLDLNEWELNSFKKWTNKKGWKNE